MTSEQLIKETLRPLIDKVKSGWTGEHSDEEVLGVIVSKFLEWDASRIITAAYRAFEDSNYRARIDLDV